VGTGDATRLPMGGAGTGPGRLLPALFLCAFAGTGCLVSEGAPAPDALSQSSSVGTLGSCAPGVELLAYSDALDKVHAPASSGTTVVVGEISGIVRDPGSGVYYGVADRAGNDPSHVFTLDLPLEAGALGEPRVLDMTFLRDGAGRPLDGGTFDGEGIVLWVPVPGAEPAGAEGPARGTSPEWIIASEGGGNPDQQPGIHRFTLDGDHLGALPVPERFLIGRNNLSFESLALAPSGTELFTIVEGPLPEDGETEDLRGRLRLLRYRGAQSDAFVPAGEYHYQTEPGRAPGEVGAVELLALSDHDLLVMERGWVRDQGNTVRIFQVSLDGAPDVSELSSLAGPLAPLPLPKRLLVDLATCPDGGATSPQVQPNPLLDNFEAMAFGPGLPDGRRSLVLVSDDNRSPFQVTRVVVLAWEGDAPAPPALP
jgi:hypothetical protein